jgi:N-acetylmuramic acid 6-phosphate etherase
VFTESESNFKNLDELSIAELVAGINQEDQSVATSVEKAMPEITALVEACSSKMQHGGRLFYLGAGTSGRLGVVDASECPPTYGVAFDRVIGIMAGGDGAIRKAVEFAEDDEQQGIKDLLQFNVSPKDFVVGITASGRTPYVLSALQSCKEMGILTGGIACNDNSSLKNVADYTVEVVTGPEFVTGSTRMKAGTATKMVLNMITTSVMIKLGHVKGNKMVDMQLTNLKLIDRGTKMVMEETGLDYETAKMVLLKEGSVRNAVDKIQGW